MRLWRFCFFCFCVKLSIAWDDQPKCFVPLAKCTMVKTILDSLWAYGHGAPQLPNIHRCPEIGKTCCCMTSWEPKVPPPKLPPEEIAGLIKGLSLNKALGGGTLGCHDDMC